MHVNAEHNLNHLYHRYQYFEFLILDIHQLDHQKDAEIFLYNFLIDSILREYRFGFLMEL